MCHANKYKLCAQLQHPVTQLFYKLPFPSFLLLASIIKKQNKKNNNKKTASLFATYSTTILVAAELSQLQGAQILFVAFSSFVYLLFVPTIPTEMGKAVFLLGFFFSFLNDFDSFCKTQEVGAFLTWPLVKCCHFTATGWALQSWTIWGFVKIPDLCRSARQFL